MCKIFIELSWVLKYYQMFVQISHQWLNCDSFELNQQNLYINLRHCPIYSFQILASNLPWRNIKDFGHFPRFQKFLTEVLQWWSMRKIFESVRNKLGEVWRFGRYSLIFMQFSTQICQIIGWRPHLGNFESTADFSCVPDVSICFGFLPSANYFFLT